MMSKYTANIILVGPMGVGKTSVGRALAQTLVLDFVDSDAQIVARTGVSIEHIFDVEGEAGFRLRETETLEVLCQKSHCVIATGGGCVTQTKNRVLLQRHGFVVYLFSTIAQLLQRTANSNARPLLNKTHDREQFFRQLLDIRQPLYQSIADVEIDTTHKKLHTIVNEITQILPNVYHP